MKQFKHKKTRDEHVEKLGIHHVMVVRIDTPIVHESNSYEYMLNHVL